MPKTILEPKHKILIGIDTGVNTGLAIYDRNQKRLIDIDSTQIHRALTKVKEAIFYSEKVFVRVEDARLRKWIPKQQNEKAERGRAAGAGSVKRDALIWEDFLEDLGLDYELVAPKSNKTKLSAPLFNSITGVNVKTNEHSRDAAMLVFGY